MIEILIFHMEVFSACFALVGVGYLIHYFLRRNDE